MRIQKRSCADQIRTEGGGGRGDTRIEVDDEENGRTINGKMERDVEDAEWKLWGNLP